MQGVEKDPQQVFANVEKYLRSIYIWPQNGREFSWRNCWRLWLILIIFSVPTSVGLIGHIYISLKGLLISDLINDIVYVVLISVYLTCGIFFMTCCEKVVDTIWEINNPKHGRPKNFARITVKMEYLTTFVHHYVFCISASYVIFFVFWDTECNKSKKFSETEYSFGYVCGVPSPAWFPYDLDSTTWRCYFIACNIVNLVYILPRGAVMIILFYGFIVFTVDRIEHLRLVVKQMDPQKKGKRVAEVLEYCINNYTEITSLVKDINGTIGVIFASTQNGLVILIIAALEYQAIMEKNLIALFALTIWILVQAVACKCGQLLEDASTHLKAEIYNIPWYRMNIALQKDYKIFHAQVQRGFHLRMKPSIFMNMEYFRQVINKSYSFLMFLTNLERVE